MRVGPRGLPPTGCAWGRFPRGDATSPQTEFLAKRGRLPASAPGNPREAVGGTTLNSFPFFLLFFVPFYSHCCQEYVLPFFAAPPLASSRPAPLHRLQTRLRFVQSRGGPAFPRREKRALPVCAGKAKLKKRRKKKRKRHNRTSQQIEEETDRMGPFCVLFCFLRFIPLLRPHSTDTRLLFSFHFPRALSALPRVCALEGRRMKVAKNESLGQLALQAFL